MNPQRKKDEKAEAPLPRLDARSMVTSDYDWLAQIQIGFRSKVAMPEELMGLPAAGRTVFMRRGGRSPIGAMIAQRRPSRLHLLWLGVDVHFRGQGFGREMLEFAACKARRFGLPRLLIDIDERDIEMALFLKCCGFRCVMEMVGYRPPCCRAVPRVFAQFERRLDGRKPTDWLLVAPG